MTAGEDQFEPLVRKRVRLLWLSHGCRRREQPRLGREGSIAPDAVDRAVPCRPREPRRGVLRGAVARPTLRGNRERLLGGFLGEVEVAEEADQPREYAAPVIAEDLVEVLYHSTSGRTST